MGELLAGLIIANCLAAAAQFVFICRQAFHAHWPASVQFSVADSYFGSQSKLYQRWRRKQDVDLRQEYKAGEKGFVDWAGATIPLRDAISEKTEEWVSG